MSSSFSNYMFRFYPKLLGDILHSRPVVSFVSDSFVDNYSKGIMSCQYSNIVENKIEQNKAQFLCFQIHNGDIFSPLRLSFIMILL